MGMHGDLPDSAPDDLEALRAALLAPSVIVGSPPRGESHRGSGRSLSRGGQSQGLECRGLVRAFEAADREDAVASFTGPARNERHGSSSRWNCNWRSLKTSASEDDLTAEQAATRAGITTVSAFTRQRPARKPFPEHLPRERVIVPGPTSCASLWLRRGCPSSAKTVTETLEVHPAAMEGDPARA